MPSLFAGPPKAPAQPTLQQKPDPALDAQLLATKRRQMGQAGVIDSRQQGSSANVLTHSVTGG